MRAGSSSWAKSDARHTARQGRVVRPSCQVTGETLMLARADVVEPDSQLERVKYLRIDRVAQRRGKSSPQRPRHGRIRWPRWPDGVAHLGCRLLRSRLRPPSIPRSVGRCRVAAVRFVAGGSGCVGLCQFGAAFEGENDIMPTDRAEPRLRQYSVAFRAQVLGVRDVNPAVPNVALHAPFVQSFLQIHEPGTRLARSPSVLAG